MGRWLRALIGSLTAHVLTPCMLITRAAAAAAAAQSGGLGRWTEVGLGDMNIGMEGP